jgi:hypothetical protein
MNSFHTPYYTTYLLAHDQFFKKLLRTDTGTVSYRLNNFPCTPTNLLSFTMEFFLSQSYYYKYHRTETSFLMVLLVPGTCTGRVENVSSEKYQVQGNSWFD